MQSYPFMQITDNPETDIPLSRRKGSTIGNVWGNLPAEIHTPPVIENISIITNHIGELLISKGYAGIFGLDFIITANNAVFVQEINPRMTASIQMITQLEREAAGISLLDLHYAAFTHNTAYVDVPNVFPEMRGMRLIGRNTTHAPFLINTTYPSGVYAGSDFAKKAYQLATINDNEYMLFSPRVKTEINTDEELFQVQFAHNDLVNGLNIARKIQKDILEASTS